MNFDDKITIGFVGYTNVGKSSIMNVLFGQKSKNGYFAGKTKYFQTLYLNDNIIICDCQFWYFQH